MSFNRVMINAADIGQRIDPLARVNGLSGVRVEDVGQGDALTVLDGKGQPALHIDFGGVQSGPFKGMSEAKRLKAVDKALPVAPGATVMLTHWDEDHWASAVPKSQAVSHGDWLVPRQWTSPAATAMSLEVARIHCIPPHLEAVPNCFVAANGDELWWEKLKPFRPTAHREDCNRSGVAFSIVQAATGRVIFLPGDAPFHLPSHYRQHAKDGLTMRGLVAFHHGAATHWAGPTHAFLDRWRRKDVRQTIVYSAGAKNRDNHPVERNYLNAFPAAGFPMAEFRRTSDVRGVGAAPIEIRF